MGVNGDARTYSRNKKNVWGGTMKKRVGRQKRVGRKLVKTKRGGAVASPTFREGEKVEE